MMFGGSFLSLTLLLASCAGGSQEQAQPSLQLSNEPKVSTSAPQSSAPASQTSAAAEAEGPTVPGFAFGQMPAIPLFEIPDLGLIEQSISAVNADLARELGNFPGLKISPARCDNNGVLNSSHGTAVLYDDGGSVFSGKDKTIVNDGDGAGTYSIGGETVVVSGDGSGVFSTEGITVVNSGDGSGSYSDEFITVVIDGDGGGNYSSATATNINYGDGGGVYSDAEQSIVNDGTGGGTYSGFGITIVNSGDGTGLVNGLLVDMEPLDKVPALGKFPSMGALIPVKGCGTVISLDSGVLFDIDEYKIRSDSSEILDTVAQALDEVEVGQVKVQGHTDNVRDDAWNQELSENRANAVVEALETRGSLATFEAEGFGESRPVANNDTDTGRQLNRRVEIFIPST